MSAHGLECLLFFYLLSAPQTDRYYKNNTDNSKQSCLKSYAPLFNPLNYSKDDSIELVIVCQALFVRCPATRTRSPEKKLLTADSKELMYC